MGLKHSEPTETTEFVSLDSFYNADRSVKKNVYESRLSSSSVNKQLVHKTISYTQSTENITRYLALLQNMGRKIQCSNLYLPALCSIKSSESVCTDYQLLNLYYEHYDVKIKDQIQARRRYREKFSEQQIWYILYSILNGVRMFEKFQISSGNLKTDKILLNDKGHLKVVNIVTWPENTISNQSYTSSIKRFYAPEELRAMRERIEKKINQNIAETFSVGVIILELATFIPGDQFYDMQRLVLNDVALQRADRILFQNYSRLLYNLIKTMLSDHYDRPLPSQICAVFKAYEKKILSLRPFDFQRQNSQNPMYVSNASLMSL